MTPSAETLAADVFETTGLATCSGLRGLYARGVSGYDARRADPGSEFAVADVLGPALDELRWRHPDLRASCGAFVGPAIRGLATSRPESMGSLVGIRAVGAPATAFAELLSGIEDVSTTDVREHEQLRWTSPAILGEGTRAAAIVPLRAEDEVVGFLCLDALRPVEIDRAAVEQLHDLAPLASVAILLEHERVRSRAHIARVQELRASMCRQTVCEREAGLELQQASKALREVIESVAPRLEHAARMELGGVIRQCIEHVEIAAEVLSHAGRETPTDEGHRRVVEPS